MTKVFISHKNDPGSINLLVARLYRYLVQQGVDAFYDRERLRGGEDWQNTIFNHVSSSDVLIVVLSTDGASTWVKREVDWARACRIKILPVVMRRQDEARLHPESPTDRTLIAEDILEELALATHHYIRAIPPDEQPGLDEDDKERIAFSQVRDQVIHLAPDTRKEQEAWIGKLRTKWEDAAKDDRLLNPPIIPEKDRAIFEYRLKSGETCALHLAVGDITEMKKIAAIVNAENVYMQMQRIFAKGISSSIRKHGTQRKGSKIAADVIQDEINAQLFGPQWEGAPLGQGDVLITSAGYERGRLRKNGVRYIFHVAVTAATEKREYSLTNDDSTIVQTCTQNCLEELEAMPADDAPDSIIFPMLGSGNAGLDVQTSAEQILLGIIHHLREREGTHLKRIYLGAFTEGNALDVFNVLQQYPAYFKLIKAPGA